MPVPEQTELNDKPDAERRERRNAYLIYASIFIFSLIALATAFLIEESILLLPNVFGIGQEKLVFFNKLIIHLLDELGIAGLIACGLAVTIERFSTKEFTKHAQKLADAEREAIKQDVFHSVFGHFVPPEIIDEMKSQILVETFLRKNFFMVYTLRPFGDVATRSTFVLVDFQMKYDVVNLSPCRRVFALKAAFSRPPIPSLFGYAKFIRITAEGCEEPFTLSEEQVTIHPQTASHVSLNYQEPIWVKPGRDNPTTITIHSQTVKHFAGGSSYFSVEYPTADLELTAQVFDPTLEVSSGATPVSPRYDWLKTTANHKPELGYYNWELQRPLLAFQGVYLTWDPKELVSAGRAGIDGDDKPAGES